MMKFLVLLLTLASVAAQLDVAPQMVVYFVNEKAHPTTCSESDLRYIDSRMLPNLDATLQANNYETPDWSVTSTTTVRHLEAAATATSVTPTATTTARLSNCDFCRRHYPRSLCNGMFNCGFRRQLRQNRASGEARTLESDAYLASGVINDCHEIIKEIVSDKVLSRTCRIALKGATCHVEFV
jgi:hypothetical protein